MDRGRSSATDRVRLSPGRHGSPSEGACVVELASLLAGEDFSDRPECVCPVIGAFLRAWNDRAAYADRQRLRPYAERVIGSRASAEVTRQRRDLCLEWSGADLGRGRARRAGAIAAARLRIASLIGVREAMTLDEGAPEYAARLLLGRRDVAGAFVLLDAMLAIGYAGGDGGSVLPPPETAPATNGNGRHPEPNGNRNGNGNGRLPELNGNGNRRLPELNGNGDGDGNGNGHVPAANGNGNHANGNGARAPARSTSTTRTG